MAIFDSNTLRPEERTSGFKIGNDDQELFRLNKLDSYPGILPDFEFEENSISSLIAKREGIDMNFEIKKINLTESENLKPIIDISPLPDTKFDAEGESFIKDRKDIDDLPPLQTANYFDDDISEDLGSSRISYGIERESKAVGGFESSYSSSNFGDEDYELKSILEQGLEIGQKRNTKQKEYNYDFKEVSNQDENINNIFGESADVINTEDFNVVYDFDDIKAESPSKLGLEDLDADDKNVTDKSIDKNEADKDEKKKKKGLPLWGIIGLSVAATLVLVSIIGLVGYKLYTKKDKIVASDTTHQKNSHSKLNTHNSQKSETYKRPTTGKQTELVAENDDVKVELKVEVKPENDSLKHSNQKHNNNTNLQHDKNGHFITQNENNVKNNTNNSNYKDNHNINNKDNQNHIQGKITFKDKTKNDITIKDNKLHLDNKVKDNKHFENTHTQENVKQQKYDKQTASKDKSSKEKVDKGKVNKEKDLEITFDFDADNKISKNYSKATKQEKKESTIDKKIQDETFITNETTTTKNEKKIEQNLTSNLITKSGSVKSSSENKTYQNVEEEYSVQVYSTLSKSDADEMVKKIKSMGVSSPYIVKQMIRDEVWYRVRFGNYPSKDEAKIVASKYGFSQVWIDRVK